MLLYLGSSYDKILITWQEPITPNGVIQSYQLSRNNTTPWSFTPQADKVTISCAHLFFKSFLDWPDVCTLRIRSSN